MNSQTAQQIVRPSKPSPALSGGLLLLVALGVAGLVWGISKDPQRAWQAYLVNFLFFFGFGVGGVLFAAILNMASGKWGRNVKRIAEGLGAFLPVSFVLFLILIPGLKYVVPWFKHGAHVTTEWQRWWLDESFMIGRGIASIGVLLVLGAAILYRSWRVDIGYANGDLGGEFKGPLHKVLTRGWKGVEAESAKSKKIQSILSPIYAICFAWLLTILAVDLIMSLEDGWYSTLIGGYYFVGCVYVTLAAMLIAVVWTRKRFNLYDSIGPHHLHDIAKLCMAFGVVTADFFYGQLFVIWYGNIPHETVYVIDRMYDTPWRAVGIVVLIFAFLMPIVAMLNATLKKMAAPMVIFGIVAMAAMWLARFFEIAPTVSGNQVIPFGPVEILVTLGFIGLLGFTYTTFIHRMPPVTLKDPVLD